MIWSLVSSAIEVIIFQVDIEIGEDQLVLDLLPDDAGHLVAVDLDNGGFTIGTSINPSVAVVGALADRNTALQTKSLRFSVRNRVLRAGPEVCRCGRACRNGTDPARRQGLVLFMAWFRKANEPS